MVEGGDDDYKPDGNEQPHIVFLIVTCFDGDVRRLKLQLRQ